jgi:hypothetical protein
MNAKPVVRLRIERKEQKQQQFEANKIASKQKNDKLYLPYERERERSITIHVFDVRVLFD